MINKFFITPILILILFSILILSSLFLYTKNENYNPIIENNLTFDNQSNESYYIILNLSISQENFSLNYTLNKCYNESAKINENLECVFYEVYPFYKYNLTDDNISLTNDELIKFGGDCKNWMDFYNNISLFMNYNFGQVTLNVNESMNHVFGIYFNKDGYCKIDQLSIDCVLYGGVQ